MLFATKSKLGLKLVFQGGDSCKTPASTFSNLSQSHLIQDVPDVVAILKS